MKYFISLLLTTVTLFGMSSTLKIPEEQCMKSKYGHILGSTIQSKQLLKRRLTNRIKAALAYDENLALKILQRNFPDMNITHIEFTVKNCYGFYKTKIDTKIYYFDPKKLTLIKTTGK